MAAYVMPRMKSLFVEHDAALFAEFDCETCHGGDMQLGGYKMPSEELFALPADDPVAEAMDYDEEITEFMVKKVVPEMARLFDQEAGTPTGVSCFTCHPQE